MSGTPNVVCLLAYYENETSLSKNAYKQKMYGEKRKFYSSSQSEDYIKYVDKGSKEKLDYVAYSGNNEKSSGVFGGNGLLTDAERKELRKALQVTDSVIWDMVLTFKQEFGHRYIATFNDAYTLMKREFPRFLKSAGFNPDNIIWYAGFHTNTEKNHLHISFFEKEPERYRARSKELQYSNGSINPVCLNRLKINVEQRLTNLSAELKLARKDVTETHKNVLFSRGSKLKYNIEYQERISELLDELPSSGRLAYDGEQMQPLRSKINEIVDTVIKSDKALRQAFHKFCVDTKKHDDDTRDMLITHKIPPAHWDRYLLSDTYLSDLYRRLGNQVINCIRTFKGGEKKAKSRLAQKRIRKASATKLLTYSFKLQTNLNKEAFDCFEEYMRKLKAQDAEKEMIEQEMHYEME